MLKIRFKKLYEDAIAPTRALEYDAGFDLTARSVEHYTGDTKRNYIEYGTGIAIELPIGYTGLLFPRSSISNTRLMLANAVGVIDPGYIGEIKLRYRDLRVGELYLIGDRIGQLVILKLPPVLLEETTESLEAYTRGDRGFGSTN